MADRASEESSAMLSTLERGELEGDGKLYRAIARFLNPFKDFISIDPHFPPEKIPNARFAASESKKKKNKKEINDAEALRPLAKRFLPFLSQALKILPISLKKCPREDENRAEEMFAVYRLVLDCLQCISSCLSGKPFSTHLQRCNLLHCLENWGKFSEADMEGFTLLESLGKSQKGNLLPDSTKVSSDRELAILVVEIVLTLMRCTYKSKQKVDSSYDQILRMVGEIRPWLRVLDSEAYNKYHLSMVNTLFKCSLFLSGECHSFDQKLVRNFCMEMFREWLLSSSKDQFPKIARQVCCSISASWEGRFTLMLEILECLLDSIAQKGKHKTPEYVNKILEFVHYVAESQLTANSSIQMNTYKLLCKRRTHLEEVSLSLASILGFYAAGVSFRRMTQSESSSNKLDYLQIFRDSSSILVQNFDLSNKELSYDLAGCTRKLSSLQLQPRISSSHECVDGDISFFSFLDALAFLCNQLYVYVTSEWKDMMSERKNFLSIDKDFILDAFHLFCALFLKKLNEKSDRERLLESRLVLFHVIVASLKFSFLTSKSSEGIVVVINDLITREWITTQELKYLASSFYNIGASLYNADEVEKASIALLLCCTTSWTHITLLGQLREDEAMIKEVVVDAFSKSAVALDVIKKNGGENFHDTAVDCLLGWVLIEDQLEISASPSALVKQWVKIICRDFKDAAAEDSIPSLSLLLKNKNSTLSKKVFGIILEQELLAYEECSAKYPNLSVKLQLRLLDVLLKEVYIGDEHVLERSKLFIKKGRALKTSGANGLKDSLDCFSTAISSLEIACDDASRRNSKLYYQLVLAYFLHAQFTQEFNGEEEVILKDITTALSWWALIAEDIHLDLDYDTTLQLCLSIADLLALKGHLHYQLEMCKLIILLRKQNNISLESSLAMLWSNRRLSHWSCSSPIDEIFVRNVTTDFGVSSSSLTFWMDCMKCSHSASVGFLQAFSLSNPNLSLETTLHSHITFEDVETTARALLSCSSPTNDSAFEAGYLLFDLSERLLHKGHMFEALSHAREALRLRKKILQKSFVSVGEKPCKIEAIWSSEQLFNEAVGSFMTKDMKHTLSSDSSITPWSTLRCYLQSILQVGIINECIGNGTEAEILFRMGKTISFSLGFPVFSIYFSFNLGQIHRKKQLLNLAENELNLARGILEKNNFNISCKHCKAVLDSLIDLQAGDFHRSKFENTTGVKCAKSLSDALEHYKSAIKKLDHLDTGETTGLLYKDKDLTGKNKLSDDSLVNGGGQGKARTKAKRPSRKKTSASVQDLGSERNQDISDHKCTQPGGHQNLKTIDGYNKNASEIYSMSNIILANWKFHKRLLLCRLLSKIGKCLRINTKNHEVHEIFWRSMSLLLDSDQTGVYDARFLELIGMENSDDSFPVQRAILLYEMSIFCVKDCFSEEPRIKCCGFSKLEVPTILSWLFTAFILAQDIPLLFQKVCRSIAAIICLSKSMGYFSLPFVVESLTENHLAAFFHQASIGCNLQHLYESNINSDIETKNLSNCGSSTHFRMLEKISDLEKFIIAFFSKLPNFSVICISLLGGEYINLLGETLLLPSFYPAWMLLSRMNRNGPPTVMLLPADFIHEEILDDSPECQTARRNLDKNTKWECPWGNALADHVAPQYKAILEDNYMSLLRTSFDSPDTQKNRVMWWSERSRLNERMEMFLRTMEESWFGPWRCLLLPEHMNFEFLDTILEKLKHALEHEYKLDANMTVIRIILGGSETIRDAEGCLSQVIHYKGHLGRGKCCGAEGFRVFGETEKISVSIRSLLLEAFDAAYQRTIEREPIVLVLDSDLQMLPWESLPVLRKEEVYRMPSMSSITLTLARNNQLIKSELSSCSLIPSINPLNAYFLLNPGGDLSGTQIEFEDWFRLQNWTGKAGNAPTMEELLDALQNHDLFLYFGHGSGMQYVPGAAIQRLERCAATLLMGCSSGSLSLRGNYTPQGAPLSYLLAGSPAVIANLWDVSDKDIDKFGKSMLTSWLESTGSNHVGGARGTRRRTRVKDSNGDVSKERRVASCMGRARDACKLPHIIGAAPVCFGVPTLIKRST